MRWELGWELWESLGFEDHFAIVVREMEGEELGRELMRHDALHLVYSIQQKQSIHAKQKHIKEREEEHTRLMISS